MLAGSIVPVYLVTYDLVTRERHDYEDLHAILKGLGGFKSTESSWFVVANLTASQVQDRLGPALSPDDRILVIQIQRGASWSRSKTYKPTTEWLTEHIGPSA